MSVQVQFRRGTSAQHATFTGAAAEITVDTTNWWPRLHDGSTAGGIPIATQAWVSAQLIAGVADGSLTPAKFANTTQNTFLGRITAGSGAPSWLTASQTLDGLGFSTMTKALAAAVSVAPALAALGLPGTIVDQWERFGG